MENVTSIVGAAPEVSAPVRTEGQSNSEVLFNWMTVKGKLWMLEDPHLERFESTVGFWAALRVLHLFGKWSSVNGHLAPAPPSTGAEIDAAFALLDKLLKAHFFGSEEK